MKKLIINFLTLVIVVCSGNVFGQELDAVSDIWLKAETNDFSTIQQTAEDYFADKDQGRGSGYKQWKRWEYMNEHRLTPNGEVTNYAMSNWNAAQQYFGFDGIQKPLPNTDDPEVTNGSWYFLAPTSWINGASGYNPGIGRIGCIAFHPTNANIFYVGTPSGGMWKTTNGGSSWVNLCDGLPAIGVSGIVIQPSNTNVIYILTGDGDGADTKSIGVLKTTDGGTNWQTTGLSWNISSSVRGYKLRMHPTNSNILFAATNNGIYKTTNGASSWTQVATGTFYDIEFKPGDPTIMYASKSNTFYRSTNTGSTWTATSHVISGATRTEIGVSADNPVYVYTLSGPTNGSGTFKGVYRSFDSGLSFGLKSNTPNILGYSSVGGDNSSQTTYDLAIAISGTDEADIVTGGINCWKSTNFGLSWSLSSMWNTPAGDYTHADIHALEVNPLNNYLYCGSDGGIFRSTDFGNNWTDLTSGLSNTQWYRIASYEPNSSLIIGGTQDNGSNKWSGGSSFTHMYGADGMDAMIDHSNSNILYFSTQNGGLRKSTNGGTTSSGIKPSGSSGTWVTPYIMDPSNSNIIYGGYTDVYRSTNGGSSWSNMGVNGSGAMAMGTNNTSRIYASTGSTMYMSNNAGSSWTTISGGLPAITISFIAVNPDWSLDVFVTVSGFTDGSKVFRSTDAGTSWTNITGSLPNVVVNCIAYEDNNASPDDALYIGTDIGVFYRDNTLGDWIPFGNWLPTVPVFDLEINEISGVITAGTYGRGLWRSSTYSDCPPSWTLNFDGAAGYSYYQASDYINSARTFNKGVGQEGYFKAANQITLTTGFHVTGGSKFKAWTAPCGTGIPETNQEAVKVEEDLPDSE